MFIFSQLQSLVEVSLELLLESIHLILLLLDEFGLRGDDFLMSLLHVLLSFLNLKLLAHHLHLMGFGVFLLLSEPFLDLLLVQELGAEFKSEWQLFFKQLSVLFDLLGVSVFELAQCLSVLLLGMEEILVPLLVELLVLFNVSLLTLFSLLCLIEDELLVTTVVVLMLQLCDSVFGHLCLNVLLLVLASPSVVLQNSDEVLDVVCGWLLVKSLFHVVSLHFEFYLCLNL